MRILKFGGTSVATPKRIKHIINIIKKRVDNDEKIAIVFSAFGGVTDQLLEMSQTAAKGKDSYLAALHQFKERHHEAAQFLASDKYQEMRNKLDANHDELRDLLKGIALVREVSPRTLDYVLSFGERNSAYIIAKAMENAGIAAHYLDARRIIKTNKDFTAAQVNFDATNSSVVDYFSEYKDQIMVMTGFIAADIGGLTTTLGRGGSDYSASILAGALRAEALEIWTDVDGVLTSDPRKVKKAFTIPNLSYAEAMEMSHFGAKVIYPPTIQPALTKNIPIYIRNTFNSDFEGTLISKESSKHFPSIIKGISSISRISLLKLQGPGMVGVVGMSGRFFGALGKSKVNVILITQASSEHSICVAINQSEVPSAINSLAVEFDKEITNGLIDKPLWEEDCCIMTVVGEAMKKVPGVAGKLFSALGRNGINIKAIAHGSSKMNISFVINERDESKALNVIHDSFYMSDNRQLNLFIVGVGLIGGELIHQIQTQRKALETKLKVEINVVGISNSKNMLIGEESLALENWQDQLSKGLPADLSLFVERMIDCNLPNSIFVDNTANTTLPSLYEQILKSNISIATPNKVATSSSQDSYDRLKKIAADRKIHFRYETNVGAGLPVIVSIQNLINSGDTIQSIEAVVSGSLSYIFNNFDGKRPFSALVREARALGFTEPDPREDLSGNDVKRKIIILSRESGYKIEPEDIKVDSILPDEVMNADSVDQFFEKLERYDSTIKKLIQDSKDKGEVLRFVAKASGGRASVALESIGADHPFFTLESSDNMFVIRTDRYSERPLIIRGPGAGAQVTAAGVFADILMMA